jgi:hypothetical protein
VCEKERERDLHRAWVSRDWRERQSSV